MIDKRWNIEEDEPLQIVDSQGEYEPVCVLYSEDAPKVMDLLNQKEKKIEQLKQENNKIKNILLNKRKDLEYAYNCAAKAGMPTGGTIGELDTIEEILEEIGLKND